MIPHTPTSLALLESGHFLERNLIKAELSGGADGVWNDDYDILYEDLVYKGLNNFQISPLTSTSNGSIEGVTLLFAGIDQDNLNLFGSSGWHQKPIYITRLILHPESKQVELAIKAFAGRIDRVQVRTDGEGAAFLEVACESWDRDKQRIVGGARASANQVLIDSEDKFFQYVGDVSHKKLRWGA